MKKSSIIIVVLVVIVLAFLIFRKDKTPEVTPALPETPTEETPILENETPITETPAPTPAPQTGYSYTNDEFDFAVKLPGLVVTAKGSSDPTYKPYIFTFGVGDQSNVEEERRIPNTMAVYVWKNRAEFDLLMLQMTPVKETVNGEVFDVYTITEGERASYRYTIKKNSVTYDVGVWNKTDAVKFFLL